MLYGMRCRRVGNCCICDLVRGIMRTSTQPVSRSRRIAALEHLRFETRSG